MTTHQALNWNLLGKRKWGHPRNTWGCDLEAETEDGIHLGTTWEAGPGLGCLESCCRWPKHQVGPKVTMIMIRTQIIPNLGGLNNSTVFLPAINTESVVVGKLLVDCCNKSNVTTYPRYQTHELHYYTSSQLLCALWYNFLIVLTKSSQEAGMWLTMESWNGYINKNLSNTVTSTVAAGILLVQSMVFLTE